MNANSLMQIHDYEAWVSLGCSAEEQSLKQPVQFNIQLEFTTKIRGETTDQLADAVDYVMLTDILKQSAESKSYHLIESMCNDVTDKIFVYLSSKKIKGHLNIRLLKLRAPVPHLKTGVSWTCQRQLS
jgi:FolB domain-containing protein